MRSMVILANAVGATLGVEVVLRGNQAATNGKVIYLPAVAAVKQALAFKGLVLHEGAHIRLTDFSFVWKDPQKHRINNMIEDIRIELVMYRLYAGAKEWLCATVEWACKNKWFAPLKVTDAPADQAIMSLLYALRSRILGQPIPFAESSVMTAKATLGDALWDELYQIAAQGSRGSFMEGVTATEEIYKRLLQHQKQNQSSKSDDKKNKSEDSEEDASPSDESGQSGEQESSGQPSGQDQNDSTSTNSSASENDGNPSNSKRSKKSDSIQSEEKLNMSDTLKTDLGDMLGTFINKEKTNDKTEARYQHLILSKGPSLVHQDLARIIRNQMGTRLETLLLAETEDRDYRLSSGHRLLGRRITQATFGNSAFQRREYGEALDTAVAMAIDGSGSMDHGLIETVLSTAFVCSEVMEHIDIPVSCVLFHEHQTVQIKSFDQSVMQCDKGFILDGSGGTPMEAGVIRASHDLLQRQESRRVMIILSDGLPNNQPNTLMAIQSAVDEGLEVVCLYLVNDGAQPQYSMTTFVNNIQAIPGAAAIFVENSKAVKGLFAVLEKVLH